MVLKLPNYGLNQEGDRVHASQVTYEQHRVLHKRKNVILKKVQRPNKQQFGLQCYITYEQHSALATISQNVPLDENHERSNFHDSISLGQFFIRLRYITLQFWWLLVLSTDGEHFSISNWRGRRNFFYRIIRQRASG